MCYFLTLALPSSSVSRLRDEFQRGFVVLPTSNPAIRRALPGSFELRLLTSGMCSCDLYREPGSQFPPRPSEDELRARFEKRGWSRAKIERAVSQSLARADGRLSFSGLRADVAARITALAQAEGPLALVVHFYSGAVETEAVPVSPGPRYRGTAFLTAAESLPVDTLVWVDPA